MKMRRLAVILFSLALWVSLSLSTKVMAYEPYTGWDILDVAVRGGVTATVGGQDLQTGLGYMGGLDVDYRLMVPLKKGISIGPKVGLGATYKVVQTNCSTGEWVYSSVSEYNINQVDRLNLNGFEQFSQWQVEMPVMLALNMRGVVLNVGLIPSLWLTQQHNVHLDDLTVQSYLEQPDVRFTHSLVVRSDAQRIKPQFHLLAGLEIGYEWRIKERHWLGIQAYCRYDLMSMQAWSDNAFCAWEGSQLVAGSLTELYPDKLHCLGAGIRIYYAFASPHKYHRLGLQY